MSGAGLSPLGPDVSLSFLSSRPLRPGLLFVTHDGIWQDFAVVRIVRQTVLLGGEGRSHSYLDINTCLYRKISAS